jgi:hypothetical protein
MIFPVLDVPPSASGQLEQLGSKSKFWYDVQGRPFLFKEGRAGTGENWAEKAAAEIAAELTLPRATYDLACCGERRGVITPSFVPEDGRLIHGNELLARIFSRYENTHRYSARMHTVRRVFAILSRPALHKPLGWDGSEAISNASGVFTGYLMLDALVGNQDRHDENWGVVVASGAAYLAPTFDHASSLGRNETDANRLDRLNTRDQGRTVEHYVSRARSALYLNEKEQHPLTTLGAYAEAKKIEPRAAEYWEGRLSLIHEVFFREIVDRIPNDWAGDTAKDFAFRMLQVNKNSILSRN